MGELLNWKENTGEIRDIAGTCNPEDNISQVVSRFQMIIFLSELCQRHINMIFVGVRVLRCAL